MNAIDRAKEWVNKLSDEEVWALSIPRPGHPEQRGFLFPGKDIHNVEEFAACMTALIKRLAKLQKERVYSNRMKPVRLGKNEGGKDVSVDLEKEGIRFILLAGMSASGKSVFHRQFYRELASSHSPEELGFVLLDMTMVDEIGCDPAYLLRPPVNRPDDALGILETLTSDKRLVFVHIEECDMVYRNRTRFEKAIERILSECKNIHIVYSTSRIDYTYLQDWLDEYVDMRVVFRVPTDEDSEFLLGTDDAFYFSEPGERMIAYGDQRIKCVPFPDEPELSE